MDLMVASSHMPRGVGHTKLTALFALEKDPRKWAAIKNADGWTAPSLAAFLVTLPEYEKWRRELPLAAYPILPTVSASAAPVAAVEDRGAVCFTGFRDAALERKLETLGFTVAAGVTKKVIAVIIADGAEASGTKVEKAKTLNIPVLEKTKFLQQFKIPV
jgi:NAD-dependent DNA ligase